MLPYYILIILPMIAQCFKHSGSMLYVSIKKEYKNDSTIKIFFAMLFLLLIFRHETVGIDLKNYNTIFEYISSANWSNVLGRSAEVGYSFVNKVVSLFTSDFRWLLIIAAILETYFLYKAYLKYSEDALLTISLFVATTNFILMFSGLRQAIAISLGFVAFEAVRKKKPFYFIIVTVIAILFHTSAFMILFMYPLYHAKIKKKWLVWIIPVLAMIFVFNAQIFGTLTMILSVFTKYDAEISSTGAYNMLILFILFAIFAYVIPDESKLDSDTIGMRNFLLLSVALQTFAPLHNLAMRMNYYYIAFIPLLIPKIIKCRSDKWNQVAILSRYVMIIFFIAYFFIVPPRDNDLNTFPYRFFWDSGF